VALVRKDGTTDNRGSLVGVFYHLSATANYMACLVAPLEAVLQLASGNITAAAGSFLSFGP
jgi:hypothetical protein